MSDSRISVSVSGDATLSAAFSLPLVFRNAVTLAPSDSDTTIPLGDSIYDADDYARWIIIRMAKNPSGNEITVSGVGGSSVGKLTAVGDLCLIQQASISSGDITAVAGLGNAGVVLEALVFIANRVV